MAGEAAGVVARAGEAADVVARVTEAADMAVLLEAEKLIRAREGSSPSQMASTF